jgi:hypothetical protein
MSAETTTTFPSESRPALVALVAAITEEVNGCLIEEERAGRLSNVIAEDLACRLHDTIARVVADLHPAA